MRAFVNAAEAARMLQNGWTITTGGFGSCGHPEALTGALEDRFLREGAPRDLTLIFAAGQGDRHARGLNRLAHVGLLKRVIGGYWGLTPRLGALAQANLIEAYNWPQGVVSHFFRAVAAGAPGVITPIGLNTFIDPRQAGGKLNDACSEDLVELIHIRGGEQLLYPTLPVHCAFIRGTRADRHGNISLEEEAAVAEVLAQAQAAHNSGGIVIVQVREVVDAGTLPPHSVVIPGMLVDYVVRASAEDHWQTYGAPYNPAFVSCRPNGHTAREPACDARKIIARRAYLELLQMSNPIVNLGIGIPETISEVAEEENFAPFTLTVESGAVGGRPAGGLSFGASVNPQALIDQPAQFDFYNGGGIDIAFLGFGQIDVLGNVNVSRLGDKINGVGGFVNISQAAKRIVFCGTFTASGLQAAARFGALEIAREGAVRKFVDTVDHLSFCAAQSQARQQGVLYITERAVFELAAGGVVLTELAPGVVFQRDIAAASDAPIRCAATVRVMNQHIFHDGPMREQRSQRAVAG